MTALVTGGCGFVGRHLVAALKQRNIPVRVFDLHPLDGVESVVGSVEDRAAMTNAMRGAEIVYHLAGNAQLWTRDPKGFDRVNRQGTVNALGAATVAGVRRFIHCSSLTTLVGRRTPIGTSTVGESVVQNPSDMLGPYPRSKLLAEQAVTAAVSAGLDAVIAVPTEPLGPGDDSLTPPTKMIVNLVNGRIPATIDCTLNFVSVKSLAEGFIACAARGRRGERYILGGDNVPMAQLLDSLQGQTGKSMPRLSLPYAVALVAGVIDTAIISSVTGKPPKAPLTGVRLAGRRVVFSSAKAALELGWKSESFDTALAASLAWMRDRKLIAA
ncbi:MAG: NAD-dependent epimerase/dehydratase family protein [Parvularculaceae bacterium]|nr:NAD-dependent epimerase/dehydratase family protein [Parvularculaceae bacterium]